MVIWKKYFELFSIKHEIFFVIKPFVVINILYQTESIITIKLPKLVIYYY